MSVVAQWVKNLVFIILFTTLLEMLLPESNMRKYVRVVMGFFIISVFISPLAVLFDQHLTGFDNILPGNIIDNNWDQIERRGERIEGANQSMMKEYYQRKIADRVKEVVTLDYPDYQPEIEVEVDEDYQLNGLKIVLKGKKKIKEVQIDSVEIDQEKGQETEESAILLPGEAALKNKLSQIFQLPISKITISRAEGGGSG